MEDIRCPMCGQYNPGSSDLCWNCQARLKPVQGQGSEPERNPWDAAPQDESADWLQENPGQPGGEPDSNPDQVPDWLARIRERSQSEQESSASVFGSSLDAEAGQDDVPDWMQDIRSEPASPFSEPAGSAEADWPEPEQPHGITNNIFDTSLPAPEGIHVEIPPELTSDAGQTGSADDWLGRFRDSASNPPDSSEDENQPTWGPLDSWDLQEPASASEQDLPTGMGSAWMAEPPASGPPAAKASIEPDDELPDWLTEELRLPGEEAAQEPYTSAPPLPDFTAHSAFEPPAETPQDSYLAGDLQQSASQAGDELEVPDWLSSMDRQSGPVNNQADELDWLGDVPTEEELPAVEETPFSGPTSAPSLLFTEDENADWLAPAEPAGDSPAGTPAFLQEESGPLFVPQSTVNHPFEGEDVPDWLTDANREGEGAGEGALRGGMPGEGSNPDLAPAQLPGWLQAMRPVEAVSKEAQAASMKRVETTGPLAGLQGILPGEDQARRYRKQPVYSVKLKVSERQRSYADRLEQAVADEGAQAEVKSSAALAPQWLIRLGIAVVLILVMIASGPPVIPSGTMTSGELLNFSNMIGALPPDSPVLIAAEFDPGFAGEMRMVSLGVLEQLIARNARISLISTVPAGPALAEELLEVAAADAMARSLPGAGYDRTNRVINLGYLPGGIASLQEFAQDPQQAAPYRLGAVFGTAPAWSEPALAGVTRLSDFAMILVLTDSSDTGRAWVEQVQPALGNQPLVMLTSASVAPVIAPYQHSGQVRALLAGAADGTTYQANSSSGGAANMMAAAGMLKSGLFLGIVFLILGLFFQAAIGLFTKKQN